MALSEDQKELRNLRKHLRNLVARCEFTTQALDIEMAKPSTEARGKTIAMICNHLNLQTDIARRYALAKRK